MNLIESLATPPQKTAPDIRSRIDIWADTLPEGERKAVIDAARNSAWEHTALREVLIGAGMPELSANAVRAWRMKQGWRRES